MEEEPPQPDDPARDHTAAPLYKRARSDSGSSTSLESIHSTRTLQSEDLEFVHENDRVYGNETYYMPCDQAEQDRLAIQHQVFVLALKGKLTTTSVTPATRLILDLGTGPGDWAVAAAQQFPHAEVVGIDMAVWDIETTEAGSGVGGRVTWEIDDLDVWGVESDVDDLTSRLGYYDPFRDPTARNPHPKGGKESHSQSQSNTQPQTPAEPAFNPYVLEPEVQPGWHFGTAFDLIHLRNMKGAFAYWEDVYAEIYKNLAPGGWVEVADFELVLPEMINAASDEPGQQPSSSLPIIPTKQPHLRSADHKFPFPTIRRLYLSMMEASFKAGRPMGTYYLHPSYLEDAGFKDVRTTYVNVPVGQWPEDPVQKRLGKMFLVVFYESLESHLLRLLTRWGDKDRVWSVDEVRLEVERGKREIMEWSEGIGGREGREGWCANFKWVVGRKSKLATD